MKKVLTAFLKIGISTAIIGYLLWDAYNTKDAEGVNIFEKLRAEDKDWSLLAVGFLFCATAVMITVVRWWYLVRGLGLPLRLKDSMRIGYLGYMFNLAPLGIVGGDLLKAFMLAHEYQESRAKAIASVIVDRLIGLYVLFIVASVAILLTGYWQHENENVRWICYLAFIITGISTVGIGVLLTPGVTDGRGTDAIANIPRVGHVLKNLVDAVRMYGRKLHVLGFACLMTVFVHCSFATGVYFVARGIFSEPPPVPTLASHMVVMPLAASMGAIPLPMGPFEAVLEFLYCQIKQPASRGLIVALGYRLCCVLIALIGVCYYLSARREVSEVMQEAEEEEEHGGVNVEPEAEA